MRCAQHSRETRGSGVATGRPHRPYTYIRTLAQCSCHRALHAQYCTPPLEYPRHVAHPDVSGRCVRPRSQLQRSQEQFGGWFDEWLGERRESDVLRESEDERPCGSNGVRRRSGGSKIRVERKLS